MKTDMFLLLIFLSALALAEKAEIIPNKIYVIPKEGFTMALQTTSNFREIITCKLIRKKITYNVSLTDEWSVKYVEQSGESVYPIDKKLCGVRILGANNESQGEWELSATDSNRETQTASATVQLTDLPGPDKMITTSFGESVVIKCIEGTESYKQCKVYNSKNELVSMLCNYNIDFITEADIGYYICRVGIWGSMYEKDFKVTIQLRDYEETHSSLTETSTSFFLTCSLKYAGQVTSHCRVLLPYENESLNIMDGLASSKFTTYGTKLRENICVLQITKPLNPKESGLYTMEMYMQNGDITGCFFNVEKNTSAVAERREIFKTVLPGSTLEISCSAPYPITYCYIIDPQGNLTLPIKNLNSERLSNLGRCQYTVKGVSVDDQGTWICALPSQKPSEDDIRTSITVTVPPHTLVAEEGIIYGKSKDTILLCKLVFPQPLQHCRFISPTGQGFLLTADNTSNSRYEYYGNGLRKGECGIKLASTMDEDYGNWICYVNIYGKYTEYEANLLILREEYFAASLAIGISVTLVILSAIWIGYVIYKKKQNKED